ncbi:hypothetical protein ACEE21_14390 [Clostridium baratii]
MSMGKSLKNFLLIFMFLLSSILLIGQTAYASDRGDVDSITFIGENQTAIVSICSKANKIAGSKIIVYEGKDGMLSFSNSKYALLPVDVRRDFMETALLTTKESGLGTQIKNKVYNFIADQDTTTSAAVKYLRSDASADFATAASWFKPFGSTFGVVLGLLSLFIFMFIGLSIMVDIAYMALPGVRVMLEGGMSGKPKWVSGEAYSSVKESEGVMQNNSYKGYMGLYFRRRVPSVIIMSIALGYLISGQIYDIIVYIIDSFSWIFSK